jgi:hypothetical protein
VNPRFYKHQKELFKKYQLTPIEKLFVGELFTDFFRNPKYDVTKMFTLPDKTWGIKLRRSRSTVQRCKSSLVKKKVLQKAELGYGYFWDRLFVDDLRSNLANPIEEKFFIPHLDDRASKLCLEDPETKKIRPLFSGAYLELVSFLLHLDGLRRQFGKKTFYINRKKTSAALGIKYQTLKNYLVKLKKSEILLERKQGRYLNHKNFYKKVNEMRVRNKFIQIRPLLSPEEKAMEELRENDYLVQTYLSVWGLDKKRVCLASQSLGLGYKLTTDGLWEAFGRFPARTIVKKTPLDLSGSPRAAVIRPVDQLWVKEFKGLKSPATDVDSPKVFICKVKGIRGPMAITDLSVEPKTDGLTTVYIEKMGTLHFGPLQVVLTAVKSHWNPKL